MKTKLLLFLGYIMVSACAVKEDRQVSTGKYAEEAPKLSQDKSADWKSEPCWLMAESRIIDASTLHSGECLIASDLQKLCENSKGIGCYGFMRMLETGAIKLTHPDQIQKLRNRSCELGINQACP